MVWKNIFKGLTLLTGILAISLYSCNPARQYEKDEQSAIDDYISKNPNLDFELKESGLYYYEMQAGTGRTPVLHDTAYVMYTGKFLNGTVFDTNIGTTDTLIFPVDEGWVISGFDEGITYMKEGGKALFLIPSSLAYGPTGYYTIGGYTPLLYEVYLAKVVPGSAR